MQSPPIKLLTQELLDEVAASSRRSPRQRQNYNFHDLSEKVQRFVNVLQPGTYVRPHQHLRAPEVNGFEFFAVIQGEVGILILNENGQILRSLRVSAAGPTRAVELPEGTIHQKTRGKPLALDMGRNSVAVSTAFNISLHN